MKLHPFNHDEKIKKLANEIGAVYIHKKPPEGSCIELEVENNRFHIDYYCTSNIAGTGVYEFTRVILKDLLNDKHLSDFKIESLTLNRFLKYILFDEKSKSKIINRKIVTAENFLKHRPLLEDKKLDDFFRVNKPLLIRLCCGSILEPKDTGKCFLVAEFESSIFNGYQIGRAVAGLNNLATLIMQKVE